MIIQIATELDELPPPARRIRCDESFGSAIIANLVYADGHRLAVLAELSGCQLVSNGDIVRSAFAIGTSNSTGSQLLAQLRRLV